MWIAALVVLSYMIGSLSFAVVTSWIFNLPDPRTYGSGNPGATNVLRTGKKLAALLTLLGDAAKGAVAVVLTRQLLQGSATQELGVALAGFAAFLGHLYPMFFGFKGGKGVATALGILLAFGLALGLMTLAIWLVVVLVSRYVSLASVVAALFAAPIALYLNAGVVMALAVSAMGLLIVWRHGANLQRLRAGSESKLFAKRG
jgi:acyl phosphate:glycerol-3-phosphate acyltransferase